MPEDEKLEFVRKSVMWIEGRDIDSCFILNFGYNDPLPWSQVLCDLNPNSISWKFYFKVRMMLVLDDEKGGKGLKLVPGTFGMNVPSACTIVIIAGT